ncbi:EAL domain-containing protein [Rahnella victoriana]|uniref:EAL domain-containing protein n=1 Tax=Rahnella victoriana TaxID=1510570 RepID=UPI001E52081D|nr:EAL domain-containing protein [Rahnella victoriana]UHM93649.1 EAL domain-containing protein [Rahnella victoriana]
MVNVSGNFMIKGTDTSRFFLSSAFFIMVLLVGLTALWYQFSTTQVGVARTTTLQAVRQVDALLDEASRAANGAADNLKLPCTQAVSDDLNHQVIVQKHVRLITLIYQNNQLCSSYSDVRYADIAGRETDAYQLILKNGNHISPRDPLLVLISAYPQGRVASSLSASYIRDILDLLSTRWSLSLRIGHSTLTTAGEVMQEGRGRTNPVIEEFSKHYPFSVGSSFTRELPISWFVHENWLAIVLLTLLAGLSGLLAYKFLLKPKTAADELSLAIKNGKIIPFYQPVIFTKNGCLAGVEVLARWQVSPDKHISPDRFIPLAEQTGLIVPMTRLLMQTVVQDLAPVLNRLPNPFHIGINISAAHVNEQGLRQDCQKFLSSLSNVQLTLEITEREPFALTPEFRETLTDLRQLGVSIALDDFGTGYSNLEYLNELPIDFIKIDKSFVGRITQAPDSAVLVECVIDMAEKLKLEIIAEGVETELQWDYLADKGISYLQGYYFSKPLPASDFIAKYL